MPFFFLTETHFSKVVASICLYIFLENIWWLWVYLSECQEQEQGIFPQCSCGWCRHHDWPMSVLIAWSLDDQIQHTQGNKRPYLIFIELLIFIDAYFRRVVTISETFLFVKSRPSVILIKLKNYLCYFLLAPFTKSSVCTESLTYSFRPH